MWLSSSRTVQASVQTRKLLVRTVLDMLPCSRFPVEPSFSSSSSPWWPRPGPGVQARALLHHGSKAFVRPSLCSSSELGWAGLLCRVARVWALLFLTLPHDRQPPCLTLGGHSVITWIWVWTSRGGRRVVPLMSTPGLCTPHYQHPVLGFERSRIKKGAVNGILGNSRSWQPSDPILQVVQGRG